MVVPNPTDVANWLGITIYDMHRWFGIALLARL